MEPIIVTGAAGFIGSHTVDCLLSQGYRVIGVDNFRTGHWENLERARHSRNFTFEELDVTDRSAVDSIIERARPQAIIHLAALVSVQESLKSPHENFRINLEATHYLACAAGTLRTPRFVMASSAAVYGNTEQLPISEGQETSPISPYGAAKLASENLLLAYSKSYGLRAICYRYFNVYGPRQDPSSPYSGVISIFQDRLSRGKPITIFGDGSQTRDFVSVYDVASANANAAVTSGFESGRYNICTGKRTSLLDLAAIFQEHYPETPPIEYDSERPGDIRHSVGSPERAAKKLGFRPTIPIEKGLSQWIRSLRDQNG